MKMKKKKLNKHKLNQNQKSFYFEDYFKTNQKFKREKNSFICDDRIYILFFCFFFLILIFSIKIILISLQNSHYLGYKSSNHSFLSLRKDIIDRNGIILSRNVQAFHAAINPNFVKDKKKFLLKIKLAFPEIDRDELSDKMQSKRYFYLKKRLTESQKDKLWKLGEKAIIFEPFQTRVYPHSKLYSHIIGQIDYDNYGISGVEGYYDKKLRDIKNSDQSLQLTLDTNIQYLVKKELSSSLKIFKADGAAALVMDAENGEVLSLVSLPDFDINKRTKITEKKFMNKITKGVFELGSIFKTFTIALALNEKLVKPETVIGNIKKKVKCSIHEISDIKKFPESMTVEEILIQSSNIGTIKIAQLIGEKKYKEFISKINILNTSDLEIDEVGTPIPFEWNKCKLETVSFGHGITTTPLQAATAYASLINGGKLIKPTLKKNKHDNKEWKEIISAETSFNIQKILRKVVTDEKGTASLANVFGYDVSGKTGTSQYYEDEDKNINTFISFFSVAEKKYIVLVMYDDPKVASELVYNYRGMRIKGTRNEAGWNAVYSAGKIIEKIGPILAINNNEAYGNHVVKKSN